MANKFEDIYGNIMDSLLIVSTTADGLMSAVDKVKLDGIATGANKYTHPSSHAATMITQDSSHRFVTDTEKSTWNAKASTAVVTTSSNGLMLAADKVKLNGIATNANNYSHPSSHPATMITADEDHRFVTDDQISAWNAKASTAVVTTSSNGLMTYTDKKKLDGIAANANNYVHPSKHAASMITQSASYRFVTDTEKSTWNAKASTAVATQSANGLMSSTDKTKLDGIATGANKYVHPNDSSTRHVTDTQISTWNAKASTTVASQSANGLMSSTDKTKLDGIATRANKTVVDSSLSSTSTNPLQNKAIYTALSGKAASSHTHSYTNITGFTASRALVSDSYGKPAVSAVTSTELGYLDGVTSNIQTQLNAITQKLNTIEAKLKTAVFIKQ